MLSLPASPKKVSLPAPPMKVSFWSEPWISSMLLKVSVVPKPSLAVPEPTPLKVTVTAPVAWL